MSVYTTLSAEDLNTFLSHYSVGELLDFTGISAGIENTNYFVTTQNGQQTTRYVLTLFESLSFDELPYFLELMAFQAERGVPCAHPIADNNGAYLRILKDKPTALVECLSGASIEHVRESHCEKLGATLAQFHLVGQDYPHKRDNPRSYAWFNSTGNAVLDKLVQQDQQLLQAELDFQNQHQGHHLPNGVIHADLFRDNVLFLNDTISGVIDLYYACHGSFLYDLAVTVNDWCNLSDGSLDPMLTQALLQSYHQVRPLSDMEKQNWLVMLRAGALRFWLSRLFDMHFPRPGEITHIKDPECFKRILLQHIATYEQQKAIWI